MEIEPRYPLFGGWKATFVIGYFVPLEYFLFKSPDGRHYLNFSFGFPLHETLVDHLTIRVSLYLCPHFIFHTISPNICVELLGNYLLQIIIMQCKRNTTSWPTRTVLICRKKILVKSSWKINIRHK
ncbi:Dolichyl-diphosphooligosaccharide--protein glycosyltransferase subunit 1B [Platanthera zijinensis]|uniref:Dolichyl-diphosphooligosaccharide--protein glycosyltransferase subunit 1 n=1 Tax=Platanthera zijinensis TaxID=2320716 RepID=A0AAP0C0R4_9ASPA